MRKNRVIEQNRCYHLVSRFAHRAFFLDDEEKDRAVALMRRVEAGVQVSMSYCINSAVSISSDPFALVDVMGLFDDGGGQQVCDEWEWSFIPQPPPMAPVWRRTCVRYRTIRGHKDFANNGTKCPFDYTKEDHSAGSSPFAPWGLWRHFRAAEDIVPELDDAISKCDADMFQRRMHQLQDTRTHYNRGWRWWKVGHLLGGTLPDHDEYAQTTAWDLAQKDTEEYVKMRNKKCRLANECSCEWERR